MYMYVSDTPTAYDDDCHIPCKPLMAGDHSVTSPVSGPGDHSVTSPVSGPGDHSVMSPVSGP
jgi:hypothetical protein